MALACVYKYHPKYCPDTLTNVYTVYVIWNYMDCIRCMCPKECTHITKHESHGVLKIWLASCWICEWKTVPTTHDKSWFFLASFQPLFCKRDGCESKMWRPSASTNENSTSTWQGSPIGDIGVLITYVYMHHRKYTYTFEFIVCQYIYIYCIYTALVVWHQMILNCVSPKQ